MKPAFREPTPKKSGSSCPRRYHPFSAHFEPGSDPWFQKAGKKEPFNNRGICGACGNLNRGFGIRAGHRQKSNGQKSSGYTQTTVTWIVTKSSS